MEKDGTLDEVKKALVDSVYNICIRLENIYGRRENFSPIAKMLMDIALADIQNNEKELDVEDLFIATKRVTEWIEEVELFFNSKIH